MIFFPWLFSLRKIRSQIRIHKKDGLYAMLNCVYIVHICVPLSIPETHIYTQVIAAWAIRGYKRRKLYSQRHHPDAGSSITCAISALHPAAHPQRAWVWRHRYSQPEKFHQREEERRRRRTRLGDRNWKLSRSRALVLPPPLPILFHLSSPSLLPRRSRFHATDTHACYLGLTD